MAANWLPTSALALCFVLSGCGLAPEAAIGLGGAALGYFASVNNLIAAKEAPPPAPAPAPADPPLDGTWTPP